MAGRKRLPVVPKAKKIKLSKTQKQYAKMIRSIEADLLKKQAAIEMREKSIALTQQVLERLKNERDNLEGAKKNLEGILNQIPPPTAWTQFTKYVYEYHYHYHHDVPRPYPYAPIYIGPWWQYYFGGSYLTYPTQSQLQLTGNVVPDFVGSQTVDNSTLVKTCEALPNSVVVNGTLGSTFLCHNSNLAGLPSTTSSSFQTPGVNTVMTSSGGAPVEYTTSDAETEAAVTALQSVGFFETKMPTVDAADMSVSDLAKVAQ
jgi:hypothetical protein